MSLSCNCEGRRQGSGSRKLERVQDKFMRGVYIALAGAREKLPPNCRPILPSWAEAPKVLISDAIDVAESQCGDCVCYRLSNSKKDERGVGIGASGMPCEGECCPCEFRQCRSGEMHEPGAVGICSQRL